jgi:hypothetical protein
VICGICGLLAAALTVSVLQGRAAAEAGRVEVNAVDEVDNAVM